MIFNGWSTQMWPTKWSTNLKDDKLLPDIGSVGSVSTATNGGSPYALPSFVSDHQGVFNGGAATSSSGDPLYDTINTMTQAQSTSIYTPPLGTSLGKNLVFFVLFLFFSFDDPNDFATLRSSQFRCILWFTLAFVQLFSSWIDRRSMLPNRTFAALLKTFQKLVLRSSLIRSDNREGEKMETNQSNWTK